MNLFEQLGLDEPILRAITNISFETPFKIQQKAIPTLLGDDTDTIVLAQTGTGKTTAFSLPLLQLIDTDSRLIQGLILSLMHELRLQTISELKNYAKYLLKASVAAVYGGASTEEQARSLKKEAQIIVATPGRMQDMIRRNSVNISHINYCVLDEIDEMFNMGFYEGMTAILSRTPKKKNTWLFSTTMPSEAARIVRQLMRGPIEIIIGTRNQASSTVQHEHYVVNGQHRYQALKRLADANPDIFSVVFYRTKKDMQAVAEKLIENGYDTAVLRGNSSQNQHGLVMKSFRTRRIQILVATDMAAHGIDIDDITYVIHYQLPDEVETYNHRSGRMGRAGKSDTLMVLIPKNELRKIKKIEKITEQPPEQRVLSTGIEICEIQLYHLANSLKNVEVNPTIEDYLPAVYEELQHIGREKLIRKIFAVEFTRSFNYCKNTEILPEEDARESRKGGGSGKVRCFINIGEHDGYNWKTFKGFLEVTFNLGRDDVFKVDVRNSFSFFNTEADQANSVMSTFANFRTDGGFINVEISDKGAGRSRGDKKDSESKRKGEDKKKGEKKGGEKGCKQKTVEAFEQAFKKKERRK